MCRQNHGVAVDYFAVGVMAYECMFGRVQLFLNIKQIQRPYVGKTRKDIRDHILSKQVQIKRNEIPRGWSLEAADFINKVCILINILFNVYRQSKENQIIGWD